MPDIQTAWERAAEDKPAVPKRKKPKQAEIGDWDVCFQMSGKLFSQILLFLKEMYSDVPFQFYKDRILIQMVSEKNSSYAEVEIKKDLLDSYNIKWGKNGENKKDGDQYKLVIIDLGGVVREISKFVKGENKITVKIDSREKKQAEFIIIRDSKEKLRVYRTLIHPKNFNEKRVIEICKKISDLRNGDVAELIITHERFEEICKLKKKKRYIDFRLLFYVNNDGLIIYSGNIEDEGRILETLPVDIHTPSIEEYDKVKAQEVRKMQYLQESNDDVNAEKEGEGRPYKKRYTPEKRKMPISNVKGNDLLALDAENEQYIDINARNLAVFTKIKMYDPIIMEIVTNRFIYLKNVYQGVKFVLVIKGEKERVEKQIEDYF